MCQRLAARLECLVCLITICETHQTWKLGRRPNLKAACDENHGQPDRFVTLTLPLPERSGSQPADSRQRDSLCCACGRLARWLPAGWRTKRCLSRSVSDEVFPPDPAPEIVTLLDGWKARKPFDNLRRPPRARGSERHAESDVRKPKMACRCWRSGGVSRRRQHERQASAHAPEAIREWKP